MFVRRAEFADLVARSKDVQRDVLLFVFSFQCFGTILSLILSICVVFIGLLAQYALSGPLSAAGPTIVLFAPTIVFTGLAISLTQALLAFGIFRGASAVSIASSLVGIALGLLVVEWHDARILAIAEIASAALAVLVSISFVRTRKA